MALTTGLVEYHKFDENTGTTVGDAVGSNPGTWAGTLGAQWTTGRINSGGNFDYNSSSYVSGMNPAINANSFSIAWWAKTATQVGSDSTINYGFQDYWALDSGAGNKIVMETQGVGAYIGQVFLTTIVGFTGSSGVQGTSDIRNSGFHHFVITASTSGNAVILYQDGAQVATNTWAVGSTVTTNFLLGNRSTSDNRNITAVMDEVGVWNRPLTSAEVTQLYNYGAGLQYPFTTTPPPIVSAVASVDFRIIDEIIGY